MLGRCSRRWPGSKSVLVQRLLFAGDVWMSDTLVATAHNGTKTELVNPSILTDGVGNLDHRFNFYYLYNYGDL